MTPPNTSSKSSTSSSLNDANDSSSDIHLPSLSFPSTTSCRLSMVQDPKEVDKNGQQQQQQQEDMRRVSRTGENDDDDEKLKRHHDNNERDEGGGEGSNIVMVDTQKLEIQLDSTGGTIHNKSDGRNGAAEEKKEEGCCEGKDAAGIGIGSGVTLEIATEREPAASPLPSSSSSSSSLSGNRLKPLSASDSAAAAAAAAAIVSTGNQDEAGKEGDNGGIRHCNQTGRHDQNHGQKTQRTDGHSQDKFNSNGGKTISTERGATGEGRQQKSTHQKQTASALSSSPSYSLPYVSLASGLAHKATLWSLSSWIALSLTLDGRDKLTKVVQYTTRLLGWYYETRVAAAASSNASAATAAHLICTAKRFRDLQKSVTESRKAFRLGRSVIELDKLRSMGLGGLLLWHLKTMIMAQEQEVEEEEEDEEEITTAFVTTPPTKKPKEEAAVSKPSLVTADRRRVLARKASSNVSFAPFPTDMEEEDEEKEPDRKKGTTSKPATTAAVARKEKVIARPNRPHLPRRVSSNIGWGPATLITPVETAPSPSSRRSAAGVAMLYRSMSSIGRIMYRPLVSQLSTISDSGKKDSQVPTWKVVGSALKLLGLMGFWAGDNLAFLTTSGFLDDYSLSFNDDNKAASAAAADSHRLKRRSDQKLKASHFAARCYFMGALAGLYVNSREYWTFRTTKLRNAYEALKDAQERYDVDDPRVREKEFLVEEARRKQFALFVALLKSCCDVIVFSNNPGVDLHKKYRGKKMNEGFHSICGLLSASTVLYNNFPNAEKKK